MTLEERRNRSDLVEYCSRFPKDCPPSHGIRSSEWTTLIGQEDIRRNWRRKVSDWISESSYFSQRVMKRWNGLSEEVVSAGTVNVQEKIGRT